MNHTDILAEPLLHKGILLNFPLLMLPAPSCPSLRWLSLLPVTRSSRKTMQVILDTSPPIHRGMRDNLDRTVFQKSIQILAVPIPARQTTMFSKSDALRR